MKICSNVVHRGTPFVTRRAFPARLSPLLYWSLRRNIRASGL